MINTIWQKGMRVSMGAFCNSLSVQCIQMYGHQQLQGLCNWLIRNHAF